MGTRARSNLHNARLLRAEAKKGNLDWVCPTCSYGMHATSSLRCPECGSRAQFLIYCHRPISLTAPLTVTALLLWVLIGLPIAAGLAAQHLAATDTRKLSPALLVVELFLSVGLGGAAMTLFYVGRTRKQAIRVFERRFGLCTLIFTIALLLFSGWLLVN